MSYGENADIWQPVEPAADKDRAGQRRVVVAGKDHNRDAGFGEQSPNAVENGRAQLIVFEGVAGQQNDIREQRPCCREHRTQRCRPAPITGSRSAILADMQI